MRCVANFEVASEASVVADDLVLTINDPGGTFKTRIKNIPRSEYAVPFLLSFHIYFEAQNLYEAEDVAESNLATCLNMLAFTTGCAFRKHRVRQIVDAGAALKGGLRDMLIWGNRIEYDDPQPFLRDGIISSIEQLMRFDIAPAIRRALRWYRLGICDTAPDDQFTYFWFALEIVAEFQKSSTKIPSKCPHCQSSLYCEKCEKHPEHRPYPKQAIRELIFAVDAECDEETVRLLDKTRNSLMHGSTLREIESSLPDPHESVVDILGNILWKAILRQFPAELLDGPLELGVPSTFVHYTPNMAAHIQTVVPQDADGHLRLDSLGIVVEVRPPGPPQSALPLVIRTTKEQCDRLRRLSYANGEQTEMLKRIQFREEGDYWLMRVLATDMVLIRRALSTGEAGEWQDLLREILKPADTASPNPPGQDGLH